VKVSHPRLGADTAAAPAALTRIGVVVHPRRPVDGPLRALNEWAAARGVDIIQVPVFGQERQVAEPGDAGDSDLVVAIGGDGTALAAIRAAAAADRPVMPVACGSLGVLAAVGAKSIVEAMGRFSRGEWEPRMLPALEVHHAHGAPLLAYNDIALVRAGQGQVRVTARLNGALFDRFAGDGCIVSTAMGSSAYSLAAGGPLLAPDTRAFVLTTLPTHGGSHPPLVAPAGSRLELETVAGFGGARLEVDGQHADIELARVEVSWRADVATLVTFSDQERFPAVLRRRRIIVDSPRIEIERGRR
jgi:NAD+ kinase